MEDNELFEKMYSLTKRVEAIEDLEKLDVGMRLSYIENQLKYIVLVFGEINKSFKKGIQFYINEETQKVLYNMQNIVDSLKVEAKETRNLNIELREHVNTESVLGTLKFMAKKIHGLEEKINSIKEDGLKKDIHLAFSVDGYEMTKKIPENNEAPKTEDELILEFFKKCKLTKRQIDVLTHRFGLFGETAKTLGKTGKLFNLSGIRISQLVKKSLSQIKWMRDHKLIDSLPESNLRIIKWMLYT